MEGRDEIDIHPGACGHRAHTTVCVARAGGWVDDIIIAPDKSVSCAIINAGGFIGLTKHDVAIPVFQLKLVDNKLVLAGATKEALKAIAFSSEVDTGSREENASRRMLRF